MRLLSTLILTHCFGYVLSEDIDDVIKLEKFYITGSTGNASKFTSNIVTIILIHECIHDKQHRSFVSTRLNSTHKCRATRRRKIILHYFACNIKENSYLEYNKLKSRWHYNKLSILRPYQCPASNKILKSHRRKLLGYTDNMVYESSIKDKQELHNKELNDFLKETEKDNSDRSELWDNWSSWSTCSVTCGNGRQVRWRHCLAGDCIKGLKKAQIKTCRQKQCDSKSILHWLGIKS